MTTKEGPEAKVAVIFPPLPPVHDEDPVFQREPAGGQTTVAGEERLTSPVTVFPLVPVATTALATPAVTGNT
jgi:hypothetical protein